jgi:hypothetical protein
MGQHLQKLSGRMGNIQTGDRAVFTEFELKLLNLNNQTGAG